MKFSAIISFSASFSGPLDYSDDDFDLQLLRYGLSENSHFDLIAEVSGCSETLSYVKKHQPDLLFLDISKGGFDMAHQLIAEYQEEYQLLPAFVFLGSDPSVGLDVYDAHGSAYLMTPLSTSRLNIALEKLLTLNQLELKLAAGIRSSQEYKPYLSARTESAHISISYTDIYYFEAGDHHTKIFFSGGEATTQDSLQKLLNTLGEEFVQVHRGYIVRIDAIQALEEIVSGYELILRGSKVRLPVSRRKLSKVRNVFKSF